MKGRIYHDRINFQGPSYSKFLINPLNNSLPEGLEESSYSEIHTNYLLIINEDKRMIERIKQRTLESLEHIAEQTTITNGNNCEFWRVSSTKNLYLPQQKIFKGNWIKDQTLHEKKSNAIYSLISRAESNKI